MLRSTTIASGTTHCCVMMKSSDNFGSKVKFPFLKKSIDVIFKQNYTSLHHMYLWIVLIHLQESYEFRLPLII